MKYKLLRFSLLSIFAMLWGTVFADQVTMKYSGTTTTNMTGENDAALFGLDPDAWSVIGAKGGNSNFSGLNKDGDFRLYYSDKGSNTITVTSLNGAVINSISMTFTGDGFANVSVKVGDNEVEAVEGVYTINSSSFVLGNANTSNVQVRVKAVVIDYTPVGGQTDTRTATTITLGEHATTGEVGTSIDLPTATVMAGETTLSNAAVTWASSKEDVATIEGNKINLLAAGKTTITATYAGDATNYKGSSANFELNVTAAAVVEPYTTLKALQEDATATSTPVTITFNNVYVNAVKSKNAYLADANGYGVLLYQDNHGLEAGKVINGTAQAKLVLYKGQTEITDLVMDNLQITDGALEPVEKTIDAITAANQSTLVTLKNVTYTSGNLTDGTNTIKFYDNFGTNVELEADKAYDITGVVILFNTTLEIAPLTADDVVAAAAEEPAGFRDIKIDFTQHAELATGSTVYITVAADGTIGTTDDATKAAATIKANVHSSYGTSNFTASVPVEGCVKITYATHDYGNDIVVTNAGGDQVAKFNTNGPKWMNDHKNVVVAYYRSNEATTLNFSNANYNPYFAVEAIDEADLPAEVTTFTVTFDASNIKDIEGNAPAALTVEKGAKVKIPANTTLFVDAMTLTSWKDASGNVYKAGDELTVDADITLTPVFVDNDEDFEDITSETTVVWQFGKGNGVGVLNAQGKKAILVTQIAVGNSFFDLKMDIDATNGKINNVGRGDKWAQCNDGTILTIPAYKGMVVSFDSYNDGTGTTIGGIDAADKSATYNGNDKTIDIVAKSIGYIASVTVVYPVPDLDEPVAEDVTATWNFVANCANLAPKNQGGAYTETTMASDVEGISMTIVYNGGSIKNNDNSYQVTTGVEMQIPVKNAGDLVTVKGYPGYSKYTIGNNEEELTGDNTYKAKTSDVQKGYVAVVSKDGNNYYYSISVTQYAPSTEPVLVEKSIYNTDFSEWTEVSATDPATVVEKQTKYTNETLNFSLFKTVIMDTEDSKFSNYTTLPHRTMRAEKNSSSYVTTSPLGNITKVRFVHGATGGNRGWKLEAKGDGDEDWVVISDAVANPAAWSEVTKDINKDNCQLRFTNLADAQNAYMFELEIFGKVDLSGAPLLETMTANGKTYDADATFEMGNSGNYEATIELFASETMPSAENPVTAVAANGEIGTITYAAENDNTVVTIPVTADEKTANYVATFIRKPMLTLTYIGVDGEAVLGTQEVEKDAAIGEFAVAIADVAASKDGYKARGWFKQNYVGEKYTTASTFTENANLYAVETEIEVASESRKYMFNLADKFFYAEDHEAFTPQEGAKSGFHDTTHGWAVYNGDKIDLLVGSKAIISVATCKYGHMTNILVKKGEETLATLQGMDEDSDGKVVSYTYEGEPGTVTLEMVATGESYIHSVKIVNVAETNYDQDGQWFFVKAGDVSSFIDALEVANGTAGTDRVFIFLPNGTYDLGTAVQTAISRDNISLIGESMEGTIVKNAPPTSKEGLMSASTIHNTGNNLYMQDLTLQNDLDYYGAGAAGRANAFHDGGDKTIAKNVKLMSYQDTYLTPANKQTYWETSEIHGAVDFICGGGDIFFEKCDLVTESRKKGEKNGEATIVAPQPLNAEKFGYVFNNCTVENQAAAFNFGRAWGGASGATVGPMVAYLNTTLNQPNEIRSTRFITAGMNEAADKFKEYNSMDKNGNVVSPASNVLKFTHSTGDKEYETILTADEAAGYALDKVFPDWTPAVYTKQVAAPAAEMNDASISWNAVDGAIAYAIFKNDVLLGITTGTTFETEAIVEVNNSRAADATATDVYTIRSANSRGGFGEPAAVTVTTGINKIATDGSANGVIYNMQGVRVNKAQKGLYIINGKVVLVK